MKILASLVAAFLALPIAQVSAQATTPDWDKAIAAAEREGSVVVNTPPGNTLRDFLNGEWPKAFPKIRLELNSVDEPAWIQRVRVERGAGKFLWDVAMEGSVTAFTMKNSGFTVPIEPELILPDVKDPKTWGGWERVMWDNESKYVLATQNFLKMPFYNAKLLSPEKAKADGPKLFLDPALKGKVIWHDPLIPGSGETFALVMRKVLGDEGLKTFVTEQAVFVANMMDLVDKMARGQYAMALGPVLPALLRRYKEAGLDFDIRPLGNTPELAASSNSGGSNLMVFKDAPHPNAARVFLNWLVSKDTAIKLAAATDQDSFRADIPSRMPADRAAVPGTHYVEPQRESAHDELKSAHELIKGFRAGKS
jgi:iron(III) transport system substrate-binding protein